MTLEAPLYGAGFFFVPLTHNPFQAGIISHWCL